MPFLMSVSGSMYYDNNESQVFFAVCEPCGWEEQESHGDADDVAACCSTCGRDAEVGSDYV